MVLNVILIQSFSIIRYKTLGFRIGSSFPTVLFNGNKTELIRNISILLFALIQKYLKSSAYISIVYKFREKS